MSCVVGAKCGGLCGARFYYVYRRLFFQLGDVLMEVVPKETIFSNWVIGVAERDKFLKLALDKGPALLIEQRKGMVGDSDTVD